MEDFFTWAMLATFAGSALATAILTQFLKEAIKIPTQWLSYIIALVVLALATLFTTGYQDIATVVIIPFNAVVVSLSANGGYSVVQRVTGSAESGRK